MSDIDQIIDSLLKFASCLGLGMTLFGVAALRGQMRRLIFETSRPALSPNRTLPEWRFFVAVMPWFIIASAVTLSIAGTAWGVFEVLEIPRTGLVIVSICSCALALMTSEVYHAQFQPSAGLGHAVSFLDLDRPSATQSDDPLATESKAVSAFWKDAIVVFVTTTWRLMLRRVQFPNDGRGGPWRRLAVQMSDWVWTLFLWIAPIVLLLLMLDFLTKGVLTDLVVMILAIMTLLPPLALVLSHAATDYEEMLVAAYVPKQFVKSRFEDHQLPENANTNASDYPYKNELFAARQRVVKARYITFFAICFSTSMFLFVLFSTLDIQLAVGFDIAPLLMLAAASFAAFKCAFVAIQLIRRISSFWQDVGQSIAPRIAHRFMRQSAHTLKNFLEPTSYGVDRTLDFLPIMKMTEEYDNQRLAELDRHVPLHAPPEARDYLVKRLDAAQMGVKRIRDWLDAMRSAAADAQTRRGGWLNPLRNKWIPVDHILEEWATHAVSMRYTTLDEDEEKVKIHISLSVFSEGDKVKSTMLKHGAEDVAEMNQGTKYGAVLVDNEELLDLLSNLTRNSMQAVRYGAGNRREVDLSVHLYSGGVYPLRFRVYDTGPGIPPKMRPQVFDPTVTTKADGSGLGLFLAKEYMAALGGQVTFTTSSHSRENSFTDFVVRLPASRYRAE